MNYHFSNEKNVQVVISLLKAHEIRFVIASPGNTNTAFIGSIQQDNFFTIYSSVDERSAAYLACGLAAETGEPVVISCTGATASRNYLSGLTEAYYRKIPILAITSTQALSRVGHHIAQVIDRSSIQNDVVRHSVTLPIVKDSDDLWDCEIKVNRAILELKRHGGGPVHINLPTTYSKPYSATTIPEHRVINRVMPYDQKPVLKGKVAVIVGAHKAWRDDEVEALEKFALKNDAPIFCDHTSGYRGKNRLQFSIAAAQENVDLSAFTPDIMIHIGEISGDYASLGMVGKEVWRVSDDGEIRDTFRRLRYVFEMNEVSFFRYYEENSISETFGYFKRCNDFLGEIRRKIPEVPMSNIWLASKLAHRIPEGSAIHFGILNSLRAWNLFELPETVSASCNVGGFGIDGCLSSLVGASLANSGKIYFGVVGDLAFFYDINVLGNRHVGKNLRILLVNNGTGVEFKNYNHHAALFGDDADDYIAAKGHFGRQSKDLVKGFSESLGFDYYSARTKEEFELLTEKFLDSSVGNKSIIIEVFTGELDERHALEALHKIQSSKKTKFRKLATSIAKRMLGERCVSKLRTLPIIKGGRSGF